MFDSFLTKIFGSRNERLIKQYRRKVALINKLEPAIQKLTDAELAQKTEEFRARYAKGETLEKLLPEAFAVAREASFRVLGQRPYDVQLIGAMVLNDNKIAEMRTGEGKTLTAVMAVYLNAIAGKGVHVVTVNDYLASRYAAWIWHVYIFLGLSVGTILSSVQDTESKRKAYAADVTYGTNNEFGFDYLRDNMVVYREQMVQRELNYAIVDEVDSILIDEARTPLIISGTGEKSTDMYAKADRFVSRLVRGENIEKLSKADIMMGETQQESGDYMCDIKARTVALTQQGQRKAEAFFGIDDISDAANTEINHHIIQALKAHALFTRDKDYVVQNGQVLIVDEFTGRLMMGRRYSDGLHQALEAKEHVKVERENKTLATITFQNYFRMYHKLAGMTGTAKTEEAEFQSIYGLDVMEIPTNKPLRRIDNNDIIYGTERGKFDAVVDEIVKVHATGQPILVGTISVEKSEMLSDMLSRRGIKHQVLNAKLHAKEAEIVAQAGSLGCVTIATNMAGRGTDILLGGNPEFLAKRELRQNGMDELLIEAATGHEETSDDSVVEARAEYAEAYNRIKQETDKQHDAVVAAGGLHIIGTERHESRRIDNQLRGRAGRQGDPGSTRFYVSLEDELMQRFGGERIKLMMQRISPDEEIPLDMKLLSKQIENAQKRVEAHNFEIRKNVLQYDDVMNKMREIIYSQRRRVLMGEDIHDSIMEMVNESVTAKLDQCASAHASANEWDMMALYSELNQLLGADFTGKLHGITNRKALEEKTHELVDALYAKKEAEISGAGIDMREVERVVLLKAVDSHWMDHIDAMDQLRQGIGLQALGQKDPVVAYRNMGFDMFDEMVLGIREQTVRNIFHVTVRMAPQQREQLAKPVEVTGDDKQKPKRTDKKPGRNDPCPCGSGLKYKNCCGRN